MRIELLQRVLASNKTRARRVMGIGISNQFELAYVKILSRLANQVIQLSDKVINELFAIGYIQDVSSFVYLFPAFRVEQQIATYEAFAIESMEASFTKANAFHRKKFVSELQTKIGIDIGTMLKDEKLNGIMQQRIKSNVDLIKSIPKEHLNKIESIISYGINAETDYFSIKGGIKQYINTEKLRTNETLKSRAKLIARDQTSKLNSELNQARQSELGIEFYIWRTVGDESVRESHAEKDGQKFRWDTPPGDTGHPGSDVQCRCLADPVLPEFF